MQVITARFAASSIRPGGADTQHVLSSTLDCLRWSKAPSTLSLHVRRQKLRKVQSSARSHGVQASNLQPERPACKGNIGCFLDVQPPEDQGSSHARAQDTNSQNDKRSNGAVPRLPRRYWQDMTTEEFRNVPSVENVIAILPVAAVEQHGPHLPVSTDATINKGILQRALALLRPELPVTVLPSMPIGKSNEHGAYPGTLSLTASTLASLWIDIGESVARAGVRKMVLFNSHGGQPQVMDIVARELRIRCNMLVVTLNWFSFGVPAGLFPEAELRHGIHGGSVETAVMMHLVPDLVHPDKFDNFESLSAKMENEGYKYLRPEGGVGFGWQTQDLHPSGACGNALDADAERGKQIVDYAAEKFVALLEEVHRYPLSNIKHLPREAEEGDTAGPSVLQRREAFSQEGNGSVESAMTS